MAKLEFSFNMKQSMKFVNEIKDNQILFEKMVINTGYSYYELTLSNSPEYIDTIIKDIDISDYILGRELDEVVDSLSGCIEFEDEVDAMAFKLVWM